MPGESSRGAAHQARATASSSFASPPQRPLRRAATLNEPIGPRRRASIALPDQQPGLPRRRSSVMSDVQLVVADILNPGGFEFSEPDSTRTQWAPMSAALVPSIAGLIFKGGEVVATDICLLLLVGVFLRWSLTQPWIWYRSAQQVRLDQEMAFEIEPADPDTAAHPSTRPPGTGPLDDVPEGAAGRSTQASAMAIDRPQDDPIRRAALKELRQHELLALACSILLPALGVLLMYGIRYQLSRPSEGVFCNFNLCIFLLAAEVRPLAQVLRLVQQRTLHLQRTVHALDPEVVASMPSQRQLDDIVRRLDALESGAPPGANPVVAQATQEVRSAIRPELDALKAAVRYYERRANLQALQSDERLAVFEKRINDAVSLAAAAARDNLSQRSIVSWVLGQCAQVALLPFHVIVGATAFPFQRRRHLAAGNDEHQPNPNPRPQAAKNPRSQRPGRDPDEQSF